MVSLNSLRILKALIIRDLYVLRHSIVNKIIDACIRLPIEILTFGYFFPLLGMPKALIPPLYLGMGFTLFLLFTGYSFSTTIMRLITPGNPTILEYELTLPIPKVFIFGKYILSYMLEACIVNLPLISIGIWVLRDNFSTIQGSWVLFYCTILFALLFSGLFFMLLPLHYTQAYFWNNIWPRRLSWVLNFGALFYTWKAAYGLNKYLALAMLFNPFTYIAEGLRSALLGGPDYIPLHLCLLVLSVSSICCIVALKTSIIKRLDPV
jgi:hypothetical protein